MVPYGLATRPEGGTEERAPLDREEPQPPAEPILESLSRLASGNVTERDYRVATYAVLERQGLLPFGLTRWLGLKSRDAQETPPTNIFRDLHVICDVNGDGVADLASNDIDRQTLRSTLRVLSGADGTLLWSRYNYFYVELWQFGGAFSQFQVYYRQGMPNPKPPNNFFPSVDVNNDGVCDLLTWSMTFSGLGIDPVVITITNTFSMLNGSYGPYGALWARTERTTITFTFEPLLGSFFSFAIVNLPTGFAHVVTPNGARWILKTTDISLTIVREPIRGCYIRDWRTSDRVRYADTRRDRTIWVRNLTFASTEDARSESQERVNNITLLAGATDMGGDNEFEIVLDQLQVATPHSCPVNNPIDNRPLFRYGRSMTLLALRGENGLDLWQNLILDEASVRVNSYGEEPFEVLIWTFGQIISDVSGDGRPDAAALYLTQERNMPTTVNGRLATHLHLVDGASGNKLWADRDVRVQGWGFPVVLSPPGASAALLALGTTDMPPIGTPGDPAPPASSSGRFPPKDVRLVVLAAHDGTTVWSYREQFAQDSYLSYEMTLNQFRSSLAPYDWNEDGLLDVLTPSQYVQPSGANQTLLARATHRYDILNAADGAPLASVEAFGPTGLVAGCGSGEPTLTIFSGHARRFDVSRHQVTPTPERLWRFPLWNDPTLTAATLGKDIVSLGAKCLPMPDGRVVFSTNLMLYSAKRGLETVTIYGLVNDEGTGVDWMLPPLVGNPPVDPEEILKYFEVEEPSPSVAWLVTLGPALPGLAAGLGLARFRGRRRGGKAK